MFPITIRNETEKDFREVEILTRKAFWIVIFGNPDNYVSRGFKSCKKLNICAADGSYPAAMLAKELVSGALNGARWVYHESPAYAFERSDAEKFDEQFEPMKKEFCPSQEEFYIHSHSIIRD